MTAMAATVAIAPGAMHGKSSPNFQRALRADPVLRDELASASADTIRRAAPSLKALRSAGAGSDQTASRWQTEGFGSPVFAHDVLILGLSSRPDGRPGVLVAHAKSTLMQALMPLSNDDLVERYWLLNGIEAEVEGLENRATAMFARDGDLLAQAEADEREAGVQEERAAVSRELHRRKIDPRTWRTS